MKALLLSAYDAASHRRWRRGLQTHLPEIDWTVLTLPNRRFFWRIWSNGLTLAYNKRRTLEADYDVVVATSMVDVLTLRALVPSIGQTDTLVYFHENQFAYPERPGQTTERYIRHCNIRTAAAGDRLLFNSDFNRDSFLDGVDKLMSNAPDCRPDGLVDQIRDTSCVVPVPLENSCFRETRIRDRGGPLKIVWNHRWEYDKAPDRCLKALFEISDRGFDFELYLLGTRFNQIPQVFKEARDRLEDHILVDEFVEDAAVYRQILVEADLVISSALHEFQGLAVLEALAAGCRPLVPDRLAYRDYVPDQYRYPSYPEQPAREIEALIEKLSQVCAEPRRIREAPAVDVEKFRWAHLESKYREQIEEVTTPHERSKVRS